MESFFAIFADSSDAVFLCFMFVSFVLLSNITVADCIINENVMLLFIKNEHFTLLNSVRFWGTSSPRPPDQGLCPWTPLGTKPPDPQYSLALPRSASMLTLINLKISDPPSSFSTIRTLALAILFLEQIHYNV